MTELEAAQFLIEEKEGQIVVLRAELAGLNDHHIKHMEDHARLRGRHDKACAELDQKRRQVEALRALNDILIQDNLDLRLRIGELEAARVADPALVTGGTSQKGESLCQNEKTESTSTPSTG